MEKRATYFPIILKNYIIPAAITCITFWVMYDFVGDFSKNMAIFGWHSLAGLSFALQLGIAIFFCAILSGSRVMNKMQELNPELAATLKTPRSIFAMITDLIFLAFLINLFVIKGVIFLRK